MAVSEQVDFLEPVNLADHLDKVELYLGQVCQIAGISKMQLDYWTNKAQIPTKGKKQRIYDIDALETVMLIKQAKDKGLNLGAAIDAARRFRESQRARSAASTPAPALAGLAQRCRRLLGRQRVDVEPGAELEAGEDRQPRQHLEVPVPAVVQPTFSGRGPSTARSRRRPRRRARARRRAARSRTVGLVLDAARSAARTAAGRPRRHEQDEAVPLRDDARALARSRSSSGADPARLAALGRDGGRLLRQPDELRVGVRRGSRRPRALVDERVQVAEPRSRAPRAAARPRRRASSSLVVELGERADVARRVDDDLLPLEGRDRGSGRRARCQPGVSAAASRPRASVSGGVRSSRPSQNGHDSSSSSVGGSSAPATRPGRARPAGRDDDRAPGERVAAELGPRLGAQRPAFEPSGARGTASSRSIGAGKTIVVDVRRADLEQRLQVAQLERDRVLLDHDAPRPSAARRPGTRPRRRSPSRAARARPRPGAPSRAACRSGSRRP